jgi:amino acid permease
MTPSNDSSSNQHGSGGGGSLSPFVCACFTLNYLIGTGFLTLPWAFERAGIILSMIAMCIICFVSNIGVDFIVTSCARAEVLMSYRKSKGHLYQEEKERPKTTTETTGLLLSQQIHTIDEEESSFNTKELTSQSSDPSTGYESDDESNGSDIKNLLVLQGKHKYELTELCKIFLGDTGLKVYGISVALDCYGFLWAYASVFGAAMAHSFPLFGPGVDCYQIYVILFAVIVVPMSFLELAEQASMQIFLSGCRIACILFMIITPVIAALFESEGDMEDNIQPIAHFDDQTEPIGSPLFRLSKIHEMLPIVVYSVIFHQAVPGLVDEMKDRAKVGKIFAYTFGLCGILYSLLGIIVSWYFGNQVHPSSNINWTNYHAGTGHLNENGEWLGVSLIPRAISLFVVVFPALDVISSYPINAYTLGNSLLSFIHADNIDEVQQDRRMATLYRGIAAIPPIFGALFIRDLGIITDFSGLTGLAIAFCFPPLLYIRSERMLKDLGIPYKTCYEGLGSSKTTAQAIFAFGVFTIIFCTVLLIVDH